MKANPVKLLEEAMKLSPESRAALAGSLIESLDEAVDEDAEAAWEIEIGRRLKELQSGDVKGIPWSKVRRKLTGR